jgi:antitoxin ParD1/3/4
MGDIERLTVALPTEMAVMVKLAVDSGDYASVSEVIRDALRAWKFRRSAQLIEEEEIRSGIAQGIEDLAAGRTKNAEDVLKRLEAKYLSKE